MNVSGVLTHLKTFLQAVKQHEAFIDSFFFYYYYSLCKPSVNAEMRYDRFALRESHISYAADINTRDESGNPKNYL